MPWGATVNDHEVKLTIVRSGGFAGLSRQWSAVIDPQEPEWEELLTRIPRDDVANDTGQRDRFVYLVTCEPPTAERPYWQCEVPEGQFTGPWQDLLERVRAAGDSDGDEKRAATRR